jgi:hypothetical protein
MAVFLSILSLFINDNLSCFDNFVDMNVKFYDPISFKHCNCTSSCISKLKDFKATCTYLCFAGSKAFLAQLFLNRESSCIHLVLPLTSHYGRVFACKLVSPKLLKGMG